MKYRLLWKAVVSAVLLTSYTPVFAQTPPGKPVDAKPDATGWLPLFDGKTLSGWQARDKGRWTVDAEGVLVGEGPVGHLFSPNTYTNLEFEAQIKLNHKGNSGMYIRTAMGNGFPKGYETQVENTSSDPQRTGSLYGFCKVAEQLVQDDTWWTQHVIAIGNRIIVKVNDKIVVDYVDEKNTYKFGHLALQQHNEGSVVMYKNLKVRPLPADGKEALVIVRQDMPEVKDK
jgi:hypothetical protein